MVFSLTDPNKTYKGTTRIWAMLIYPGDSCPDDYISYIDSLHIPCFLSPMHSPDDRYPDEYKIHRHLMIMYDGKKSDSQVLKRFEYLNGTLPFIVDSKIGYGRYLCHLDEDPLEKPIYSPADVVCFAGANYIDEIIDSGNGNELILEINELIERFDVIAYHHLNFMLAQLDDRYLRCLRSNVSYWKTILSSRKMEREKGDFVKFDYQGWKEYLENER